MMMGSRRSMPAKPGLRHGCVLWRTSRKARSGFLPKNGCPYRPMSLKRRKICRWPDSSATKHGQLFECASNYQTVLVTFVPRDAECAVAGIGLQHSLAELGEKWSESYANKLANTLRVMRGRQFNPLTLGATWHVFKWVINHADCYQYLESSASDMEKQLDGFATEQLPLQAWSSQCTWIPIFDHAGSYERTAYEDASVVKYRYPCALAA